MIDGRLFVAIGVLIMVIGAISSVLSLRTAHRATWTAQVQSAVLKALPGGNCGACGNSTCFATARGIAHGRLPDTACVAGGDDTAHEVRQAVGSVGAPPSGS